MTPAERAAALSIIRRTPSWKLRKLHDGRITLFVPRGVGHFHVPLDELTDQDITNALPCEPVSASMAQTDRADGRHRTSGG